MRGADAVTLFRSALAIGSAYLVLMKYNPWFIVLLIAVIIFLDAVDGFLAIRAESYGEVDFMSYAKSQMGDMKAKSLVQKFRKKASTNAKFGARMDVAGDRVVEYTYWVLFTYLGLVPLFVTFIVIIRHSFADAFMGAKGTSSHMRTRFADAVYSSKIGRFGINVVKFAAFSYLALVYILGYPLWVGYALTAILVAYILLRGAAEIWEATR
ncbi:MAG: CDP-alcohol phosphatidyltransferase family protein [Candidatus Micrarchaeota archaeon]|nr:CDP-alcohol phosphatidyltransferase family protein [Candidatus Micrarchaeota archaeon]